MLYIKFSAANKPPGYRCLYRLFFALIIWLPLTGRAQTAPGFYYTFYDSVQTISNSQTLRNAWAGGFNAPQFSTIDLNSDGRSDLFVFDRTSNKIATFLQVNNALKYAPEYEALFPEVNSWCLLVDFNMDGKKDLFTASTLGIRVFRNETTPGGLLNLRLFKDALFTKGLSGLPINLQINQGDMPALIDVDNDGDLDVLSFAPLTGYNIEFNKNISKEKYQRSDSLEFEKADTRWGSIEKCHVCDDYLFGNNYCRTEQIQHIGASVLALDMDGDQDKDLLLGDINCPNLGLFINEGSLQQAAFRSFTRSFPLQNPAGIALFPAAYYEDVNFDGIKDLLIAPNTSFNEENKQDFRHSAWLYTNQGSNNKPVFVYAQKDFLQQQMIDVGQNARPAFADMDADGDLDLFVSHRGQVNENGVFTTGIFCYQNTGSQQRPVFTLYSSNYLNLAAQGWLDLHISFADLNGDSASDLVMTATRLSDRRSAIYWLPNLAAANKAFVFDTGRLQTLDMAIGGGQEALFYDADNDGDPDLLLTRPFEGVSYYENSGKLSFVLRHAIAGGLDRQLSGLAIADLDNNGKDDLLAGTADGALLFCPDFAKSLAGSFATQPLNMRNMLNGELYSHRFGSAVFPAVYGKDMLVGTEGGGLLFLRQRNFINGLDDKQYRRLELFPNPASGQVKIRSLSRGLLDVYTASGQLRLAGLRVSGEGDFVLDINTLPPGLYLIRFMDAQGRSYLGKLVVE